jgi:hypothetical protein
LVLPGVANILEITKSKSKAADKSVRPTPAKVTIVQNYMT